MRALLATTLFLAVGAARAEEDDDPKRASAPPTQVTVNTGNLAPPGWQPTSSAYLAAHEDDPKLQREADVRDRGPRDEETGPPHAVPSLKLAWRHLTMPNLDKSELGFNAVELDMYPISTRFFRVALDAELGMGSGMLDGKPINPWFLISGVDIGFQYPWRITPFVDLRFVAGIIGGDVAGQAAITSTYMYGIDGGFELYLVERLYLSAAIGYAHVYYKGVDLAYTKAHPLEEPKFVDFNGDTVTFKLGIGL
jgi:hypothetical protein